MAMKSNELVKNINFNINQISSEMTYYKINDNDINIIKQNNIHIYKDHGNYYCIISMQQLYQLFPNSSRIKIKYYCLKCGKINILDCQNITRKLQSCDNNLWCQKCTIHIKQNQTLHKYSNIATSKQQMFFYNMFKEISVLNYLEGVLHIDITLLSLKIGIEYNGGEHDLDIKLKSINKQEFIAKEWRRRYLLMQRCWKIIYIISPKDKIDNYTYDEYIKIFNYCYYLFQIEKEQFIEVYIENNFILTKQSITYITDILKENNISQIKNMQIFTINKTIEYLHISKKTLYSLNNKKILLINITPMNFKYYIKNQLDEYIKNFHKISDNYFTINEAAIYLNTTVNKILLLKNTRELYPLIINDEEYYEKWQLNNIQKNKILERYMTFKESSKYLNLSIETIRCYCIKYNINIMLNNNIRYITLDSLNYLKNIQNIQKQYISTPQAAKYLNIPTPTLRKLTNNNIINYTYINNRYLYKLEDLKKYKLQINELDAKYFTINQVIEYLKQYNIIYSNTTIYSKFKTIKIDNIYYFEKNQIFEYVQQYNQLYNDLQTNYYNTKQVANLLSIHANLLSVWNKNQLLIPDYIDLKTQNRFYLKTTIIDFINKMINSNQQIGNNIYYTVNQAAKYLNININSILEWKNDKLIPDINIDNNYFYAKKQLDQYLLMQQNFITDYLNTKQAIQYLNIPVNKFFKYIRKYNISADKIYNNEKYYLKDIIYELQQLINNENNTYDDKMTETDAMQYLNISRGTIQKLVKQGKLTAYAKDHSHKYYIKKQLDEYKEENNLNNYYTIRQAANLLQFKYRILLYRINKNELPFNIKIINGRKYIIRTEVDEYLKNNA